MEQFSHNSSTPGAALKRNTSVKQLKLYDFMLKAKDAINFAEVLRVKGENSNDQFCHFEIAETNWNMICMNTHGIQTHAMQALLEAIKANPHILHFSLGVDYTNRLLGEPVELVRLASSFSISGP